MQFITKAKATVKKVANQAAQFMDDAKGTVKGWVAGIAGSLGAAFFATAALAGDPEPTPIETLFAGANLGGVQDLVLAMGGVIVAIALVFVGIKLVKRGLSRT